MQQHGSLKIYNSVSKVKMLVVSQNYHLPIRKPKKSAHFKAVFSLVLIFDDFGFGSKYVCPLFQFFVGRRSFRELSSARF